MVLVQWLIASCTLIFTICSAAAAEASPNPIKLPTQEENAAFLKLFHGRLAGIAPAKVDPKLSFDREEKKEGYTFFTVSYNVDEGERVSAYMLVPDHEKGKKLPLVFCLHATHRDGKIRLAELNAPENPEERRKWENRSFALELVRRGFVCFMPDRGGYGERSTLPDEKDCFRTMALYQEQLKQKYPGWEYTRGKVPADLSRALDALLELDWIDGANVGSIGHSLGGWDTLHFWGTDPRVKAAVVNSGGNYRITPALWTDSSWRKKFLDGEPMGMENIVNSAQVYIMLGAPRPFLFMRGIEEGKGRDIRESMLDSITVVDAYYQTLSPNPYEVNGKPQFGVLLHSDGHVFASFARETACRWLERQLMGKY